MRIHLQTIFKEMYMNQLNQDYLNYKQKRISIEELKTKTLEFIFKERYYFNFYKNTEDELTDLIIALGKILTKVILSYKENRCTYSCYIRNTLNFLKKARYYRTVKEKSKDVALTNYAIEEASFELQEKEPEYSSSKKLEIDFEALVETENQKKLSMKQRLKIVLLKCCFYLSDENILEICEKYELSYTEIKKNIDLAKKTFEKRYQKSVKKKQNTNRIYFLKNRYRFELELLNKKSIQYEKTKESLEKAKEIWLKYINKNIDKPLTPSNQFISETLNIPYYAVNLLFADIAKKYRKNAKKELS